MFLKIFEKQVYSKEKISSFLTSSALTSKPIFTSFQPLKLIHLNWFSLSQTSWASSHIKEYRKL